MEDSKHTFEGWAILELMGHRRLGGYVSEVTMFGASMCRIDVPGEADTKATQFYGGSAVYCLTPTSEATARAVARGAQPAPVHRWELPAETPSRNRPDDEYEHDEDPNAEAPAF